MISTLKKKETSMFFKLFLAFTLIPVAEIYLIIKLGGLLGAFNTIAIIILTGIAGATLARVQGLKTMLKVQENLQQGIVPAEEMIDALLIFVAGVVLLTPGFLTDAAGLLLLFPPSRFHIKRLLRRKFDQWKTNVNIQHRNFP
jgi:UPF0716 protein FxsA